MYEVVLVDQVMVVLVVVVVVLVGMKWLW